MEAVSALDGLGGANAVGVNDARYADYIAFADPRTGLYAIPDGLGGKRKCTAAEFWLTPGNVSYDSSLYGVRDLVLSAQTTVSAAVTAVLNATDATLVFESYARVSTDRMVRPNAGGDLFLLQGTGANARMVASPANIDCTRRRGDWTNRFRAISSYSAAGASICFNGGTPGTSASQPGARTSPNFIAGRYTFIGMISSRKSDAWMKGHSFPFPSVRVGGDSFGGPGDTNNLGRWYNAASALIPGNPPYECMAQAGTDGPTIEAAFLAEDVELSVYNVLWGGHNSYNSTTWKGNVENCKNRCGLANLLLMPTFPSVAEDQSIRDDKSAMHAYFKATYGPHYLGRALDEVVALGAPGQAYEDSVSYALGCPPVGLRADGGTGPGTDPLHLNKICNETIIAPMVPAQYPYLGWRI